MKAVKRLMRPVVCVAFVIALSIALAACGGTPSDAPVTVEPAATATAVALPTATATLVPQATATAAAAPTYTAVPTASATAVADAPLPTATATNEFAERLAAEGMAILTEFTAEYSPRESGSPNELAAAEFIKREMEALGYEVTMQPVEVEYMPWGAELVSLLGRDRRGVWAIPMTGTGSDDVMGRLVPVGRALEGEVPAEGLEFAIALIERGEITFEEKVRRVSDAGAVAAIIYNDVVGNFRGDLQSKGPIPAVSVSRADGEAALEMLKDEPGLEARVRVIMERLNSQNVIAELPGRGGECGVVALGAHYDSVQDTQAAGDNGTGVASMLVMAKRLADHSFAYSVRFILFGVEEIGLFGSRHYVDSLSETERKDIIAMLNFDAMGRGDASVVGSDALVDAATSYAAGNALAVKRGLLSEHLGSDHAPFIEAGIPAIFFFGDDFSLINSPADVLGMVEPPVMGTNMAVGLGMLDGFECNDG